MKNTNPILLFRHNSVEEGSNYLATYSMKTGLHTAINCNGDYQSGKIIHTNSIQTKSREAIDTAEFSEL